MVEDPTQEVAPDAAPAANAAPAPAPAPTPVPASVSLNTMQTRTLPQLYDLGAELGLRVGGTRSKHQLAFEILCYYSRKGAVIEAEGVLEITREGFGYVRNPRFNFMPLPDDVFMVPSLVRKLNLRTGLLLKVEARAPRDSREKFITVDNVISIEGLPADTWQPPTPFDKLTALFPTERIVLENARTRSASTRVIDIVAPAGKGQRALICAPPRGGKTILIKEIAQAIEENHKEIELIILLLDERPEEVTDFRETVKSHVYASTFDEPASRHIQVSDLVLERAKRLVEHGRDVVVILDSLTRLARGHNNAIQGGPLGSGGVSPAAMQRARKVFSSARKVEEGGSLTIIATALIETENRLDMVVFEEFKGTGNMEIQLDRELVERRIFPAINVQKSGTRNDDRLYHPDEFKRVVGVRRQLAALPAGDAMEALLKNIRATSCNAEILLRGLQT